MQCHDPLFSGFAAEAIDFLIPLCKKYPFFGWMEEVETAKWKESYLFQGLPTYEQDLLEKCNERGKELMEMDNIPGKISKHSFCKTKR